MSLIKEIFAGHAARIRLENSLQLQKAKLTRPSQIKIEIASINTGIVEQLNANPQLAAEYAKITLEVPA